MKVKTVFALQLHGEQRDTAHVEGVVSHSREPLKEYGLAIEMSCDPSWSRHLAVSNGR
jgi:hypothetical protein